ncbi:2OG-Fe(II) oxygenase family protein [Sphingomicrobium lutaoense]|nr:putative 2OG-Fe(II) oxygenase [Sphingomicrobium lutaoense]
MDRNDLALPLVDRLAPGLQRDMFALYLRGEMGEAVARQTGRRLEGHRQPDGMILQYAGALEAEGRQDEAIALLSDLLEDYPDWIAGQQCLAQLQWTLRHDDPASGFAKAVKARPDHELLHAAWLGTLKSMEDHARLAELLPQIEAAFPSSQLIRMVAAEAYSEMGQTDMADTRFTDLRSVADPSFDAARMRHEMRAGRPCEAARIGAGAVASHGAPECWAWLGAALRALSDPQADWFYRGDALFSIQTIALDEPQRASLAKLLRSIHRGSGPPFGQSPRGGTQTLGPLLKRRDKPIIALRRALKKAVRSYVDALPPVEPRHPFLARPREAFRFEGAWSIRLLPEGHHVAHIHSHGWISSALYVDLPEGMGDDPDRKGWLDIGVPPINPEGRIEPLGSIAPAPLKLALFPSIFWHGTRPFDAGERLTVAFDVVPR